MQVLSCLIASISLGAVASAYDSNCEGSFIPIKKEQCIDALNNIDTTKTYKDQQEFSSGHCYLKYATNGSGDQDLSGQRIRDVAQNILDNCSDGHGSYGTGNCEKCHVTVNYRS
ncbi:uncharacterized protein EURHEDRAFT_373693 [Aspergillus ruber CBS 135680]|uniref:Uncharacterized protein n=1 Tax=Aspergillus ruber (strain CBS 135680) TaxID=1388766 RepID=A0A017SS08_ASPRC|nr:uncharacterized protein EURHEDRAFT_373693 [Aspergillus ruber CBS 135680]EYE99782.1 hypothetical protein EURHEDRAFT_373693 [Aspergillus ruber CBS 135680]